MTRIRVGTHMLHARIRGVCTVVLIQGDMLIRTSVRTIHAVEFGEEQSQGVRVLEVLVWCPPVEKLASLQQAPGRLHVETWAGRGDNPSLWVSQEVEIMPGCADMVTCLLPPFFSSVSPGPGREVRNGIGWSLMVKTARSGVWLFRGALSGNSAFFALVAFACWVKKGSFLTAWTVLSTFFVFLLNFCMGGAWLSGHNPESGVGHC